LSLGSAPVTSYTLSINDTTNGTALGPWHPATSTAVMQFGIGGLTDGHMYRCAVTATNEFGAGPAAVTSVNATQPTQPPSPDGVRGVAVGDGAVEVVWNPVHWAFGPITYNIYSVSSSGTGPQALSSGGASVWVRGLANGTSYFFNAVAVTGEGVSSTTSLRSP
jgi:hypothetical protein